jgi:FkbM family methyltransferase
MRNWLRGLIGHRSNAPVSAQDTANAAELARVRKECACRQHVGNVIARYFIKHERTADIAVPFNAVTIDSDPAWMEGVLSRADLTEPEFAVFRFFKGDTGTILDIGANYGYSAATIWASGATSAILSFEPNAWHVPCLERIRQMRPRQFDFLCHGLGDTERTMRFVIPVVEGVGISGLMSAAIESETDWAIPENLVSYMMTYHPDIAVPRLKFAEVEWRIAPLDTLLRAGGFAVPLDEIPAIKIDVEGFEAAVIAGASETLRTHRPFVMVEGANRDPEVLRQFIALGYLYADFVDGAAKLSDQHSTRVSGFYLHETRLDDYRARGLLIN